MTKVEKDARGIIVCVLLTFVGACGTEIANESDSAVSDLELVEELGDEVRFPLTHVYAIALHSDGSVAIADGPPSRVLLFPSDGEIIEIGGNGGGPNEYTIAEALSFNEDTLWVTDHRGKKAIAFALDGSPIRSQRFAVFPESGTGSQVGPLRRMADGSWLTASIQRGGIMAIVQGVVNTRQFYRMTADVAEPIYTLDLFAADYIG